MQKGIWVIIILAIIAVGGYFMLQNGGQGAAVATLLLEDIQLEPLAEGHYEGWAIFGDEKVSTGTFAVGDELSFGSDRNLAEADAIVVTIEPEGDNDEVPSGVVVLAGDVENGVAQLSFPVDFTGATGSLILATPSNGADTEETSGIWFLTLPEPLQAGLSLPALPAGWKYEGWAVHEGTPLSSGRFSSPSGEDEFSGYSGAEAFPPFPGEDFLQNPPEGVFFPIDLANGTSLAVISVEPDINGTDPTGPGPAQIKPLVAQIAAGTADHTNITMGLNLDSLPSGVARIQ
jgi:hypothetical protein